VSGRTRIAGFAAAVAFASGAAALAGAAIDPNPSGEQPAGHAQNSGDEMASMHTGHAGQKTIDGDDVRGLAVADRELRVVLDTPSLRRAQPSIVRYRIVDQHGEPVHDFDLQHEKRMHLIIVRRDLTGFQHLHPTLAPDGTWSTRVTLDTAGSYRLFADFATDGEAHTLAADISVDGLADLRALPAAAPVAETGDGYEVRLAGGAASAGTETDLAFTVTRSGRPVEVEPYLGAGGHLVALREGDLAFLHVHPTEAASTAGSVSFMATFPTTGRYRLFLQFKHDGRVHTAAFTREVR
jgi:hypothetical protein